MVSPRKSRKKSPCFSSTTTSTPARASRKPSIIPAGPPPATQHLVVISAFAITTRSLQSALRENARRRLSWLRRLLRRYTELLLQARRRRGVLEHQSLLRIDVVIRLLRHQRPLMEA